MLTTWSSQHMLTLSAFVSIGRASGLWTQGWLHRGRAEAHESHETGIPTSDGEHDLIMLMSGQQRTEQGLVPAIWHANIWRGAHAGTLVQYVAKASCQHHSVMPQLLPHSQHKTWPSPQVLDTACHKKTSHSCLGTVSTGGKWGALARSWCLWTHQNSSGHGA